MWPDGVQLPALQAVVDALVRDMWGALLISVLVLVLFVGAELVGRWWSLETEWTRKATHLGSGAIVLTFPWLVSSAWTVLCLAFAFSGILIGGRITGLLGSIHNVERSTGGAYYYPFAVLGVWVLSDGEPLLYCVPLAIMAVADTGAALVGKHAGQTTYKVMDGTRSLEGSIAFFGLAFGIVLVGCAIAGRPGWPAVLLVTLVVAVLTTSVEAISVRGSDNLGIPYAGWLALDRTDALGLEGLGDWVMGMTLGAVLLFSTADRARLDAAGAVTVFLVSTLAYALGGWMWFMPMLATYLIYLVGRAPDDTGLDRVFPTTAAAIVLVLAYAHTGEESLFVAYLTAVVSSAGMAAMLIGQVRGWPRRTLVPLAILIPVLTPRVMGWDTPVVAPLVGAVVALGLWLVMRRGPAVGRRMFISLAVGLGTWFVAT